MPSISTPGYSYPTTPAVERRLRIRHHANPVHPVKFVSIPSIRVHLWLQETSRVGILPAMLGGVGILPARLSGAGLPALNVILSAAKDLLNQTTSPPEEILRIRSE